MSSIAPKKYRWAVAIVFGVLGFAVNFLDLQLLDHPALKVSILGGLFFPLLIALAWGWRYGLLSALAGGCQSMWWLWQGDGWGMLYSVPVFTLWVVWHGWWAGRRSVGHPWWQSSFVVEAPFRTVVELGFYTVFPWLLAMNPPPWDPAITWDQVSFSWLHTVALKHLVTGYVLLLLCYTLLSLGPARRFFRLRPLPAQRVTTAVYCGALLLALFLWVVDSIAGCLVFHPEMSFWEVAVLREGPHVMFMRVLYLVVSLLGAVLVARFLRERVVLTTRLAHQNQVLAAIRNVNQLITQEKNQHVLLEEACRLLVETRGFHNAWIIRLDAGKPVEPFYWAGFDGGFEVLAEELRAGRLPDCAEAALRTGDTQVVAAPASSCGQCPLAEEYGGRAGVTARLEHEGQLFGLLGVSVPERFARDSNELSLLNEVAGDLAFALSSLRSEVQRVSVERKYASALATTTDAVMATDLDGTITLFNPGAERLFKCSAEAAIGTHVSRFCPEDLKDEQREMLRRAREEGTVPGYETERLTAENRRMPVEIALSLHEGGNGAPAMINAILRDITGRKRAEAESRHNRELLRTVLDIVPAYICAKDLDGRFLLVNKKLADFYGRSVDEMTGMRHSALCEDPEELRAMLAADREAIERGEPVFIPEETMVKPDHTVAVLETHKIPFLAHGRPAVLIASADITERRRAESALTESQKRYRTLFANMVQGVLYQRADGTLVDCNPALESLFGIGRKQLLGRRAQDLDWDVIHEDGSAFPYEEHPSVLALRTGEPVRDVVAGIFNPRQQDYVWLNINAVPQFGPGQDTPSEVFVIMHDISARKRAEEAHRRLEEQYRHAQKMEAIGQLTGGVAHDFNNLLQVINTGTDMAMEDVQPEHPAHGALEEVSEAGQRAANLVSQLLLFSRRQTMRPEYLDLNDTVTNLLKMLGRVIGEHIQLEWRPAYKLSPIYADRGMVEQALMNLCVNARDAMPEGGALTIETREATLDAPSVEMYAEEHPGAYALLVVSDTGCGMDRETQERVFEPFYTTKEAGEGTGLGLSTVYGIVKQHHGLISIDSTPGRGSVFRLYWPVSQEGPETTDRGSGDTVRGGTETILLAEDDEMVRGLACAALRRAGYTVLTASTGAEALELFQKNGDGLDMVMLDVVMPEMNGCEAFLHMRQANPQLKVLFTSGYREGTGQTDFIVRERLPFIQKPFTRNRLLTMVRELLDRSKDAAD